MESMKPTRGKAFYVKLILYPMLALWCLGLIFAHGEVSAQYKHFVEGLAIFVFALSLSVIGIIEVITRLGGGPASQKKMV